MKDVYDFVIFIYVCMYTFSTPIQFVDGAHYVG